MARKVQWEDHLNEVMLTKPAVVVQETCQVLEKHGCLVKELKSELYYSSTLCQVVSQVLHYANLIGRPGNTLEETCTIGGRPLLSSQCTLIPLW